MNQPTDMKYIICFDGRSEPVVEKIPAGVIVKYDGKEYTGTLSAEDALMMQDRCSLYIYYVKCYASNNYDEYVIVGAKGAHKWEKLGELVIKEFDVKHKLSELDIDLEQEVTKVLLEGALSWGISYSDMYGIAEHFYELGCRHAAELYDNIEHERQKRSEAEHQGLDYESLPKWYKVEENGGFDKPYNYLLKTLDGRLYFCSGDTVPRDGYAMFCDELDVLPKINNSHE